MSQTPGQDLPPYSPSEQPYAPPTQDAYGSAPGQPYGPGPGQPPYVPGQSPAVTNLPWRAGTDDNTWALLAHLGGIFISFIAPLIVLLTKGKESGYVRNQSVEALNWTITIALAQAIGSILTVVIIGFITLPVVGIIALVFGIIATIAASKGETYKYPWALRLVK